MAAELDPVDAIAQMSFLVQGSLERRAGAQGLSLIQTRLLGALRDRKPTVNELGRLLGLEKSSTSGLIDRAERRGLVRRLPSQVDRRSVRVALTDAGRELVGSVAAQFGQDLKVMLEPLSHEDRLVLTRTLSEVLIAQGAGQGIDLLAGTRGESDPSAPALDDM